VKKQILASVLVLLLLIPFINTTASADIGPKPSVVVEFKGFENESYYVTLLSEQESTGPYSSRNEYQEYYGSREIWEKFKSYSDADGYYFLGYLSDCSDDDVFKWTYYPPSRFKILIYFPEYDRFVVSSESYERYAFDSYYTVDASKLDINSVSPSGEGLRVRRSYDFKWEAISLLCRIVATIAIELIVAVLFGLKVKRQIRVIALTNIATQTLLNVLLNLINYKYGHAAFIFNFVWMELAVFVIEGFVYSRLLNRKDHFVSGGRAWGYAFTANLVSFGVGMVIAELLPGIF